MHPLCIDCNGGQAAICKVSDHKHTFTRSGVSVVELQKGAHFIGQTPGCHWPNRLVLAGAVQVKNAVLLSATEAAEMILRVDEIIKSAPRQRQE